MDKKRDAFDDKKTVFSKLHTVNSSIKNIIVLRGGALGDFLLTLQAISALRNAFPNATLSLFAYSEAASLVVKCGVADKTFSLNHAE